MYDNYSTDTSVTIAMELGIEVRYFGVKGVLNDQYYLDVKNHCWKEQIGNGIDYVIVVDADEFVFPDELTTGTAPVVSGFNMISDTLPVNEIIEISTGVESVVYSKQAIFSPDFITEINYTHGCHSNRITGRVIREGKARLLHYRQIGGLQRMLDRHSEYRKRMSKFNLDHKMGTHYLYTLDENKRDWELLTKNARKLW